MEAADRGMIADSANLTSREFVVRSDKKAPATITKNDTVTIISRDLGNKDGGFRKLLDYEENFAVNFAGYDGSNPESRIPDSLSPETIGKWNRSCTPLPRALRSALKMP
jgi:hypothetical protein